MITYLAKIPLDGFINRLNQHQNSLLYFLLFYKLSFLSDQKINLSHGFIYDCIHSCNVVDKNTNDTPNNRQKTCGKRYIYIMSPNLSTVMQIFVREKCY